MSPYKTPWNLVKILAQKIDLIGSTGRLTYDCHDSKNTKLLEKMRYPLTY